MICSGRSTGLLAAVLVACLGLAGCSESGSEDASPTTAAQDEGPTTTNGAGDALSLTDLRAILPDADAVGEGFSEATDDGDDEPNPSDAAVARACPEAERFGGSDDAPQAEAAFVDRANRTVFVVAQPDSDLTTDDLDDLVDAIEQCEPFAYTSAGTDVSGSFSAERVDAIGDGGIRLRIDIEIDIEQGPIETTSEALVFRHGPVTGLVLAADGISRTGDVTLSDPGIVDDLAADLDEGIGDLVD